MDRRDLVLDLIMLSGKSPSRIAEEAGLSRSGVLQWLKKGVGIGSRAQNKLLSVLGVSGGTLTSSRVHFWTLKSGELSPLVRILSWASSGPFEMTYLVPDNLNFKKEEFEDWGMEPNPLAIYDFKKKVRILLRRKLDPFDPAIESTDSLVDSGRTEWRDPHPVRLDLKIFKNWWESNISVDEYDRILRPGEGETPKGKCVRESPITWETFGREMDRRGIRPEDVLGMIDREKEGSR